MRLWPGTFIPLFLTVFLFFHFSYGSPITCTSALQKATPLKLVNSNQFFTSRNLAEYIGGFLPGFKNSLDKLKSHEVWIDLGSGKGKAALEFLRSQKNINESPQVLLITLNSGRWSSWPNFSGKLKVVEGLLFEDMTADQIPQAKMITDFFGVLSYTLDLTKTLNQIFDHLQAEGELFLYSNHSYTMIEAGQGKIMGLTEFLRSIPGIKVEGQFGILKVTKTAQQIQVPSLELLKLDVTTRPIFRRFALIHN